MKVASIGAKFVKTDVGGTMDLKGLHNIFPLAYAEAPYRKFQEYNNMRGVTHTREGYAEFSVILIFGPETGGVNGSGLNR